MHCNYNLLRIDQTEIKKSSCMNQPKGVPVSIGPRWPFEKEEACISCAAKGASMYSVLFVLYSARRSEGSATLDGTWNKAIAADSATVCNCTYRQQILQLPF
jgi:hypothetical protein